MCGSLNDALNPMTRLGTYTESGFQPIVISIPITIRDMAGWTKIKKHPLTPCPSRNGQVPKRILKHCHSMGNDYFNVFRPSLPEPGISDQKPKGGLS
jgi:hypothetical protein